jgi:hypothetical protein
VNKIHHKYWNAFIGYLHILDLINVRKMEHTKMINAQHAKATYTYKITKEK